MKFRLSFWHRDHPHAVPGDVVEVPDHTVDALVRDGIGYPVTEPETPADAPSEQEPDQPAKPARKAVKAAKEPDGS